MRMMTIAPRPALASVVRSFASVETEIETTRVLLPETGAVLGIRYAGSAALIEGEGARVLPDVTLTGMRNSVRRVRTSAGGGIIVVAFHEDGARVVFDVPIHQLFNGMAGLEDLTAAEALEQLRVNVAAAHDPMSRVDTVEQFLLAHQSHRRRDRMVRAAVRAMRAACGTISINSLSAGLGISVDRFEKRFRQAVGASPKQYSSVLRLRQALSRYHEKANLTELAQHAGYYDQSHFIREFRAVTGESPLKFLRAANYC